MLVLWIYASWPVVFLFRQPTSVPRYASFVLLALLLVYYKNHPYEIWVIPLGSVLHFYLRVLLPLVLAQALQLELSPAPAPCPQLTYCWLRALHRCCPHWKMLKTLCLEVLIMNECQICVQVLLPVLSKMISSKSTDGVPTNRAWTLLKYRQFVGFPDLIFFISNLK